MEMSMVSAKIKAGSLAQETLRWGRASL